MVARRRPPASAEPNRAGAHFLRRDVAAELVAASGVTAGDLVFDLGAGSGALTAPLARLGARVVAVERDAALVDRLTRRFAGRPTVSVIQADVRTVALPHRPFRVVANLPFATTTAVIRRLLEPAGTTLMAADLVVQRGAARRVAGFAATPAGAWWGARFTVGVGRGLGPRCFRPPPSVTAAVLRVRREPLPAGVEAILARMLRECATVPLRPVRTVLNGRLGPGQLRGLGIDPRSPVGQLPPTSWRQIVLAVAGGAPPRRGSAHDRRGGGPGGGAG